MATRPRSTLCRSLSNSISSHTAFLFCTRHAYHHLILQTCQALPQFRIYTHTIFCVCRKLFPFPVSRLTQLHPFYHSLNIVSPPIDLVVSLPMTPSILLPLFSQGSDVTAQLQYFACVFILLLLSVSRKESYERRAQILFPVTSPESSRVSGTQQVLNEYQLSL